MTLATHHLVWHVNGSPGGAPLWRVHSHLPNAIEDFAHIAADPQCNWVKLYTVREDGRYLFEQEYQRRTSQTQLNKVV